MYRCFSCSDEFRSNEYLLKHIKQTHPKLTTYRCTENDCKRSFSVYYSFWKHRRNEHSDKNLDDTTTINNECSVSANTSIDGLQSSPVENKNTFDDCSFEEDDINPIGHETLPGSLNQEDIIGSFRASLEMITEQLCAKWYSITDLPRNRVQMLISDVNEFLNGTAADILQNTVMDTLQNFQEQKEKKKKSRKCF